MFNQALLAKIAWRIINVPDSLLARILIGKYCHKKNFLEVDLPKVCSHGWRGGLAREKPSKGEFRKGHWEWNDNKCMEGFVDVP